MFTARSTPNIALIKYWGNQNDQLRLCANPNLAMTLNTPCVDVTVEESDAFTVTSKTKQMTEKDINRFKVTIENMNQYLSILHSQFSIPETISITIDSQIPSSIGLASSAAVFSGLAKALAALVEQSGTALTDQQISVMARLGSGSAARSIFGGFVALSCEGEDGAIDSYVAKQIAPESHWPLHDIVIAPSTEAKKVGSTEGHASAWSSPHYEQRLEDIHQKRQQECIDAILTKDFEKLQHVAEVDALDMHHCMQTQEPALNYLSETTHRILQEIKDLRTAEHLPVFFTMDAGPTVHLFCTDEAKERVSAYANEQKNCTIFESQAGPGTHLIGN